ncbi:MAG TPA: Asp-tRNA(Asn)/Glu-tRNA(Gln) amidotransferase subunit GatC [Turneriella sp.]|nr:Asp-tRNA(Asn)/Glu-tRNA(Gln) amidotransferase subunit GatC [Turneriella sp.]
MADALSITEVQKIAGLSKLRLEGDELQKMAHDFNGILNFVAQIKDANTENTPALDHPLGLINSERSDTPVPSIEQEAIRAFAPKFEAGFFVVPRVIETEH